MCSIATMNVGFIRVPALTTETRYRTLTDVYFGPHSYVYEYSEFLLTFYY